MKTAPHRWADAREETPAAFQTAFDRTLNDLKEEQPMKKTFLRTALLAALIVALLLGTAYAVMNAAGIWDTYHTPPLEEAKNYIQTDFDGQFYENEWFTARIVEALSDGVTARIMIEYAAKDASTFLLDETEDEESGISLGQDVKNTKHVSEWTKGYANIVYVSLPRVRESDMDGAFSNSEHVSANVLRTWLEFTTPHDVSAPLTVSGGYSANGGEWQEIETGWPFMLKNVMSERRVVTVPPLDEGILHLSDITFTFTPLYTYADYTLRVDGLDSVTAAHSVSYADFYGADGAAIVSGGGYGTLVDENGSVTYHDQLAAMADIPEKLVLRYTQIPTDENENIIEGEINASIDVPFQ